MPNICGIYKIESPVGAVYIGQSREILARWRFHRKVYKSSNQRKLHNSFNKYGVSHHTFSIIHQLPIDASGIVVTDYEQFCMDQYREAGYILLNIREAGLAGKCSEETKRRISEANKGHKAHNLGQKHSQETRNKMSSSRRKWKLSVESGIKISKALKGRGKTDEHKNKLKISLTGHIRSELSRNKQSQTMKGKPQGPHSEETKKRISEARIKGLQKRRDNAILQ